MQALELNKMGLVPISMEESIIIDAGGVPWKKIWDGAKWVVERAGIVDFFSDFYDGFQEGYARGRN